MEYRTEVSWIPSTQETKYCVINQRGQCIAECKSQAMATRVARGMAMEYEWSQKMKNFTL